jgi:hypothetical protein
VSRRTRAAQRLALAEAPGRLTAALLARLTERDDWAAGYRPTADPVRQDKDGSRRAHVTILPGPYARQVAELLTDELRVLLPGSDTIYQAPVGRVGAYLYVFDNWTGSTH